MGNPMNSTSPDWFLGKKAFITGSGRGIGRSIALALAQRGCDIIVHYRRDRAAAEEVINRVKDMGRQSWLYQADLCDITQTEKMLTQIVAEHKTLDVYVANAASTAFKNLVDLTPENIDKTFHLVVSGFILAVQKLRPALSGRDAQILTISGIDTVKYCPGHGLLAAAKSSLETLTKYLAVELASDKIHTKCFNPGLVASDSTRFYMGEAFDDVCKSANQIAPHDGFASTDQIAAIALQLLQPAMNWMTGNTFHADGGLGFMLPVF
jgi:enoyl-[acyl-carrier protein] reductase III